MLRLRAPFAVPVALALAAALAGCGGEGPVARAPDGHVALALHDYYLEPTQVRPRAGRARFDVVDRGRIGHNLRVFRNGRTYLSISTLKPGERATPTVELPRGAYRLFCSVANHEELGVRGALIVR